MRQWVSRIHDINTHIANFPNNTGKIIMDEKKMKNVFLFLIRLEDLLFSKKLEEIYNYFI